MKLPRDIGGVQLANMLQKYGYTIIRQRGSHIRLRSQCKGPEQSLTIPAHSQLKLGTLNQILRAVSEYVGTSKEQIANELFG